MPWRRWGPYLSERQWGTVREDYSPDGNAWDYFTHDQARSRAYRWGEDGIAGISDDRQLLCFALALWNGRDPILKERLFGLTERRGQPRRGRQGVLLLPRLDADALVHEVPLQVPAGGVPLRRPGRDQPQAHRGTSPSTSCSTPACSPATATSTSSSSTPRRRPRTSLIRITVPQPRAGAGRRSTCCRRSGSATPGRGGRQRREPELREPAAGRARHASVVARRAPRARRALPLRRGRRAAAVHRNETNTERLSDKPNATPYVKDAFHDYVDRRASGAR